MAAAFYGINPLVKRPDRQAVVLRYSALIYCAPSGQAFGVFPLLAGGPAALLTKAGLRLKDLGYVPQEVCLSAFGMVGSRIGPR